MIFGKKRGIGTRIASARTEVTIKKLLHELDTYEYVSKRTRRRLADQAKIRVLELKGR